MESRIVAVLSEFLEAFPYQVEIWDKKVVSHLLSNPHLFDEFHLGDLCAKWGIYSYLKYGTSGYANRPV